MEKEPTFITILGKAFHILDYLYEIDQPVGVTTISKACEIPKANTFRILKTLETLGVIEEKNDGYVLGKKLMTYGNNAANQNDLVNLAKPYMKQLCEQTNETINLGIQYEDQVLMMHSELGAKTSLVSRLLPVCPLYCSSIGKLFLANLDDSLIEEYFNSITPQQRTISTITTADQFKKEKDTILKEECAYDREEYEYGLSCMSVPIYDRNKKIIAGISLSGPTTRLQVHGFDNLMELLHNTAKQINHDVEMFL